MPIHIKINCGGAASGEWIADNYYFPAYSESSTASATYDTTGQSNPAPNTIYETFRKCSSPALLPFRYSVPVPNGAYIVRLHFADDTTADGPGTYVTNLEINEQPVLQNLDPNSPHNAVSPAVKIHQFTTTVSNGKVKIELVSPTGGLVKICGIEIIEDTNNPGEYARINELRERGQSDVAQIVAVSWPEPTGKKYYATTAVDDLINFHGIPLEPGCQVEPRLLGKQFLSFELSPDLSDEEITLEFGDLDRELQGLFQQHGEGVRVEILYYYPQAGLLKSRWFGQLRPPEENSYGTFSAKAASGFMSRLLPLPRRAYYTNCSAIFGGFLETQAEVNANDCPYSKHLDPINGVGNMNGAVPFTSCPKMTRADCTARLGNDASFLGFDTAANPVLSDPRAGYWAVSRGNASNLKRPLRVIIGAKHIRDFDLLAWRREVNNSNPDRGFVACVWAVCEGPVQSISSFRVNDGSVNVQAINLREGQLRQPATSYGGGIGNFSGTAHIFARLGWVNAAQINGPDLKTFSVVIGKSDIRVYTSETEYTRQYTSNRVWALLECYANRRWGRGYAYSRFHIPDFIDAAEWCDENIGYTDPNGTSRPHRRTQFDADLQGRVAHEQIIDICRSGRLSVPFQHEGKYTIVPLRKWDNLNDCRVFTDTGEDRNIVSEGARRAISYTIQSDTQIPNEIVLTFEDSANLDIERPLTFVDQEQQFRAGRAFGDSSFRPVQKRYTAFGVRNEPEAIKLGWSLLHLGEFDSGGIKNNLRVKFTTWSTQVLGLKRYDVIKVVSPLIENLGFQYFRILTMRQQANLLVEITAQAYPEAYYESFETLVQPTPPLPPVIGGGHVPDPNSGYIPPTRGPIHPTYQDIYYQDGFLHIEIQNV